MLHHKPEEEPEPARFSAGVEAEEKATAASSAESRLDVGAVLREYAGTAGRFRREYRVSAWGVGAAVTALSLGNAAALYTGVTTGEFPFALAGVVWSLSLTVAVMATLRPLRSLRRKRRLGGALAESERVGDDLRVVGPLAEMLELHDRPTRLAAAHLLLRLLPRLTPEDAPLLNAEQRAALCRVLRSGSADAPDLCIAILTALARIGDSRCLPFVEGLSEVFPLNDGQRRVREAARLCLPALRERAAQESEGRALLRPAASVPDPAPGELLRPEE